MSYFYIESLNFSFKKCLNLTKIQKINRILIIKMLKFSILLQLKKKKKKKLSKDNTKKMISYFLMRINTYKINKTKNRTRKNMKKMHCPNNKLHKPWNLNITNTKTKNQNIYRKNIKVIINLNNLQKLGSHFI